MEEVLETATRDRDDDAAAPVVTAPPPPPPDALIAGDLDAPPAIVFDMPMVHAATRSDAFVAAEEDGIAGAAEDPADDTAALEAVLESLLLAAGQPAPLGKIVEALDGPDRGEVERALGRLAERYARDGRGLRVVQVAGGWQLRSAAEHGTYVRRLLGGKPPRLSRPMLETLAIVAYRQPCTRPEIEAIRGVDCDAAITSLLERRMLRIEGRKDAPGRPLLYGTTREFLEVFGLPDLRALPPLRELGEEAALLMESHLAAGAAPTAAPDAAPADAGVEAAAQPPAADGEAAAAPGEAAAAPVEATAADEATGEVDGDVGAVVEAVG